MEEGWRACKRGRAGEIRPLLLCTHFAVMCCHAAGAGGGAADSSLLRRLGASHQLEACRLAAETGGRCWRESVLSLRGGLADFRSYKPSKYDSDKEDDEDPILPPQLEEEARPWELEPDQKEDKLEGTPQFEMKSRLILCTCILLNTGPIRHPSSFHSCHAWVIRSRCARRNSQGSGDAGARHLNATRAPLTALPHSATPPLLNCHRHALPLLSDTTWC